MADPLTILGGLASIAQVIHSVTRLVKSLHEIRESYSNVALNITLVSGQLTTVRAALEALQTWREGDTIETEASKQLDKDLDLSLSCCAILITVITGKLMESGYSPEAGRKQKIKYVWLEDTLKEYVSNLEGQVRALQLLLTIFQCRTATEQKQQLARRESRIIIEQIRSETMSLSLREGEMDDAMSVLSQDPSVHLDVDSILMKSPAYRRVYGEKLPRRRDPSISFRNPSIRRKPLPSSHPLPPTSPSLAHAPSNTDDSVATQQPSPPPQIIPAKPPPVPPRPKAPRRRRQNTQTENSQMTPQSYNGRGNPPFSAEEVSEQKQVTVNLTSSDSAASVETPIASDQHKSLDILGAPTHASQSAEECARSPSNHTQIQQAWPTVQSLQEGEELAINREASAAPAGQQKDEAPYVQQPPALEKFKTEIDNAFGDSGALHGNDTTSAFRLSFQETSETPSICAENMAVGHNDNGQEVHTATEVNEVFQTTEQLPHEAHPEIVSVREPLESVDESSSFKGTSEPQKCEEISPATSTRDHSEQTRPESTMDDSDLEFVTDMDGFPIYDRQWAAMYRRSRLIGPSTKPDVNLNNGQPSSFGDSEGQIDRSGVGLADAGVSPDEADRGPATDSTPSQDFVGESSSAVKSSSQVMQPANVQFSSEPPSAPFIVLLRPPPNDEPTVITSKAETSTLSSSGRDSHPHTPSTTSSYEHTTSNTTLTLNNTAADTIATSVSANGSAAIRDLAQAELRRLQGELMAAKARGDSRKAQQSLQQSIDIIRRSYLKMPQSQPKSPLYPKDGANLKRFTSLAGHSNGSALNDAAASGDFTSVKALLDAKANVDARGKTFMTSLMLAGVGGHIEVMEALKNHGADEFAVDAKGRTVLHLAVASRRLSTVKWLLHAYPPQSPEQIKRRSSLFFKAADSLRSRAPKNLRESSDSEGSKPLHVAVEMDKGEILETLLAAGVEVDSRNNRGRTPLHQAIIADRREVFSTLLQRGADFNATDARSMSALHWAANTGRIDMIETLLAKGAQRDGFDDSGNQPVHQAAWMGHLPCIELLARDFKDLEASTKTGESLLHIACLQSNWELATYLLKKNVYANPWAMPQSILVESLRKSKLPLKSLTPLHYACCRGDYEMVVLFLDNGAWINAATPEGVTALMMAVEGENTNIVNLLLTRGAYVNASLPGTLETALHLACRHHDLETVQQLCRAGANFKARTRLERTGQMGFGGGFRTPLEEADNAKGLNLEKKDAVLTYLRTLSRNYP